MPVPDPKDVEYVVEATSAETHFLWVEWHDRLKWEQQNPGFWAIIANVRMDRKKWPINVCVAYNKLDGHLIAFYYSTSMLTRSDLVEKFVKKEFPNAKGFTDAGNFHNCIIDLEIKAKINKCPSCGRY